MPGSSEPSGTRPAAYSVVLFDLDGTLIDSAPGITATIAASLRALGLDVPGPEVLLRLVGPPIMTGFREVLGLDEAAAVALRVAYRARYSTTAALETFAFAGIPEALDAIQQPLAVATSKPQQLAIAILQRIGLADRFVAICGASPDDSGSTKAEVVAAALRQLREAGHSVSRPVLVGDREHDVQGAAANDVPAIFAEWGYGGPGESAGAVAIATRPAQLPALLGLPTTGDTASI